jgi:GT2 family glycosyltransferase/glycosyltransferase involved in cell wall biosynthesis
MRVLQIVHGYPPAATGGTELYADATAQALARGFGDEVTVLTREHAPGAPEFRVREERRGPVRVHLVNNTFRTTQRFEDTYDNPRITGLAARLVDAVRPDVAHVHHLTCLSTTVIDALADRGVPIVLTLHDYWLMCHRGQLLDRDLRRCDGPGRVGCAGCAGVEGGAPPAAVAGARLLRAVERALPPAVAAPLRRSAAGLAASLASDARGREASRRRLAHMHARLALVSRVIAPSAHLRARFVAQGFDGDRIAVSPYGTGIVARPREPHDGPLRLGFLGSLMVSKAPHVAMEAAARLAPRVHLHVYGAPAAYHGDDGYATVLAARETRGAVTRHDAIGHGAVASVLAALDVLVVPSVWEENSPFVIHEALACGVPVVASRIGGIPEVVREGINGLLVTPGDAGDLARAIRRLVEEPGLLDRLRAGIEPPRTLDDDVRATRELYDGLRRAASSRAAARAPLDPPARVAAVVLNYGTPEQAAMTARLLLASETPFAEVVVADNGDGAACRTELARTGSRARVVATGGNLGFSGGCNAGIRDVLAHGADAVLLVNSDVVVPPDCLGRLLEAWRARPSAGILAPVIRSRAWPDTLLSAGLDYHQATGRMCHRLAASRGAPPPAAVSGCVMLVARAVVDAVGLLPEEYFFSFEDIDYCLRARAAGFDVAIVPGATAYHEGGGTIGLRADRLYYAARNHLRLGARTPARSAAHRAIRQVAIAGYNVAHALTSEGGRLHSRLAAVARGIAHHARGRYGPAPDRG